MCQVEPFPNDPAANATRMAELIRRIRETAGADANIVTLWPECFLHHYGAYDPRSEGASPPLDLSSSCSELEMVKNAAREARVAVVVTGALRQSTAAPVALPPTPEESSAASAEEGLLPFNGAVAVDADGSVVAQYAKTHLWNGGGWDHVERDLFQAAGEASKPVGWKHPTPSEPVLPELRSRLFPVFTLPAAGFGSKKFGMAICYDIEHPLVAQCYGLQGVDVLLVPTASTGEARLLSHVLVPARAYEIHATVAYCNYPSTRAIPSSGTPVPASDVPVVWGTYSPASAPGPPPISSGADCAASGSVVDSTAFTTGTGGSSPWPVGFSGHSVVYGGDCAFAGGPSPPGGEMVSLVKVSSKDLAFHKDRTPYLTDRRTDLLACMLASSS
jgi:predicted amidohydrolase